MNVSDEVKRGVELLDRQIPGWEKRIDPKILNINSCAHCILGQLFGWYRPDMVGLPVFGAYRYGLSVGICDSGLQAEDRRLSLKKEWTRVIRRRLAEQKELADLCAAVEEEAVQPASR